MKRVFKFKKGYETDWCEDIMDFIMDLAPSPFVGKLHRFEKDTKITIIVEKGINIKNNEV